MDILSASFTHTIFDGRAKHELYNTYSMMLRRCYDNNLDNFHLYGGSGIQVCKDWTGTNGFWQFVADMGQRPLGMTVDRIDPFGNYEPLNCRWADKSLQANNTRLENIRNTSGFAGVHWCNRDLCWVVQISLNKKRTVIGRFSIGELEEAQSVYLDAKQLKVQRVSDDEIYQDFVLALRVGNGQARLKRNKTSKYWGVSASGRGKWVANVGKYLGIRNTEEEAHLLVLDWLTEQEEIKNGSSFIGES